MFASWNRSGLIHALTAKKLLFSEIGILVIHGIQIKELTRYYFFYENKFEKNNYILLHNKEVRNKNPIII